MEPEIDLFFMLMAIILLIILFRLEKKVKNKRLKSFKFKTYYFRVLSDILEQNYGFKRNGEDIMFQMTGKIKVKIKKYEGEAKEGLIIDPLEFKLADNFFKFLKRRVRTNFVLDGGKRYKKTLKWKKD